MHPSMRASPSSNDATKPDSGGLSALQKLLKLGFPLHKRQIPAILAFALDGIESPKPDVARLLAHETVEVDAAASVWTISASSTHDLQGSWRPPRRR